MALSVNDSQRVSAAVQRYSADLVRLAYSYMLSRADAQDAVQDAFVQYMKKLPEFDSAEKEKAWLMKVTVNKCLNALRWLKLRRAEPIDEDMPADEESREVIWALSKLKGKYRLCVHLHYYEGYGIDEIAGMLKANPSTVGTWLSRARAQLKTELGGEP